MNNSDWIHCDDDSMQYARKLSDGVYRLVQIGLRDPVRCRYMAYTDVFSLSDYFDRNGGPDSELASILKSYGYSNADQVREEYGGCADQIICECLFESLMVEHSGTILFTGTENECAEYISDYVSNYNYNLNTISRK